MYEGQTRGNRNAVHIDRFPGAMMWSVTERERQHEGDMGVGSGKTAKKPKAQRHCNTSSAPNYRHKTLWSANLHESP